MYWKVQKMLKSCQNKRFKLYKIVFYGVLKIIQVFISTIKIMLKVKEEREVYSIGANLSRKQLLIFLSQWRRSGSLTQCPHQNWSKFRLF